MSLSSTSTFGCRTTPRAWARSASWRRIGELLDRRGASCVLGKGADVEHLVARDRAHIELVVIDRQQHDAGLELAAPDAVDDRRRVAADQPQGDFGMAAQERRCELVHSPCRGL